MYNKKRTTSDDIPSNRPQSEYCTEIFNKKKTTSDDVPPNKHRVNIF